MSSELQHDSAPIVGTVLSTSPICSLYKIVVLPAASSPNMTTCTIAARMGLGERLFAGRKQGPAG